MKILLTGASGFIGRNLCENQEFIDNNIVYVYNRYYNDEWLDKFDIDKDTPDEHFIMILTL